MRPAPPPAPGAEQRWAPTALVLVGAVAAVAGEVAELLGCAAAAVDNRGATGKDGPGCGRDSGAGNAGRTWARRPRPVTEDTRGLQVTCLGSLPWDPAEVPEVPAALSLGTVPWMGPPAAAPAPPTSPFAIFAASSAPPCPRGASAHWGWGADPPPLSQRLFRGKQENFLPTLSKAAGDARPRACPAEPRAARGQRSPAEPSGAQRRGVLGCTHPSPPAPPPACSAAPLSCGEQRTPRDPTPGPTGRDGAKQRAPRPRRGSAELTQQQDSEHHLPSHVDPRPQRRRNGAGRGHGTSPGLESACRDLSRSGLQPRRYRLPSPGSGVYGRAGTGHPRSCCPAPLPPLRARAGSCLSPGDPPRKPPLFPGAALPGLVPGGTVRQHTGEKAGSSSRAGDAASLRGGAGTSARGAGLCRASRLGCILPGRREQQSLSVRSSGMALGPGARAGSRCAPARQGSCARGVAAMGARSDPTAGQAQRGLTPPGRGEAQPAGSLRAGGV